MQIGSKTIQWWTTAESPKLYLQNTLENIFTCYVVDSWGVVIIFPTDEPLKAQLIGDI